MSLGSPPVLGGWGEGSNSLQEKCNGYVNLLESTQEYIRLSHFINKFFANLDFFSFGIAGDGTHSLAHTRQELYHWATSPRCPALNFFKNGLLCISFHSFIEMIHTSKITLLKNSIQLDCVHVQHVTNPTIMYDYNTSIKNGWKSMIQSQNITTTSSKTFTLSHYQSLPVLPSSQILATITLLYLPILNIFKFME